MMNLIDCRKGGIGMKHQFEVGLDWENGRNGTGKLQARQLQTGVSIPREMNGPNIGTNPDEMLIGAASTCFTISFATLLENAKILPSKLQVRSVGTVDVTGHVYTFERIVHHVDVAFDGDFQRARVERFAKKAEETCMISKALKGNIEIIVDLNIR